MKKKVFYQTNILWQCFCFAILIIFIACFIVGIQLIIGISKNGLGNNFEDIAVSVALIILYFVAIALILKVFIRLEHNNIYLDSYKIYMKDDWTKKRDKIQFYSEVKYEDIKSIDIIWSTKNSKGRVITSRTLASFLEKPYISITTKNGEIVNFFIMYISKKDVSKLIDEIKFRMQESGNMISIESTEQLVSKLSKKD